VGEGGQVEMLAPTSMNASIESLSTAIGGFKIEGSSQAKTLDKQLKEEKDHTKVSREILKAIRSNTKGAGAAVLI